MTYTDWLESLDDQKTRALAAQSGIPIWKLAPIEVLKKRLETNGVGQQIFEKNYGKETVLSI